MTAVVTVLCLAGYALAPMTAMVLNLRDFRRDRNDGRAILFVVGSVLLVLGIWLCVEAVLTLARGTKGGADS